MSAVTVLGRLRPLTKFQRLAVPIGVSQESSLTVTTVPLPLWQSSIECQSCSGYSDKPRPRRRRRPVTRNPLKFRQMKGTVVFFPTRSQPSPLIAALSSLLECICSDCTRFGS